MPRSSASPSAGDTTCVSMKMIARTASGMSSMCTISGSNGTSCRVVHRNVLRAAASRRSTGSSSPLPGSAARRSLK
ncbi:hypothetical protein [Dactylosporangium cerinum]